MASRRQSRKDAGIEIIARTARTLFNAALVLCPPTFRREYGVAMRRDFAHRLTDEIERGARLALIRYTCTAACDVIAVASAEYYDMLLRDLRFALRSLRRTPLFTAVIVATLAVAIAANVAIFSILDAVVLAPLPYAHADRLIEIQWRNAGAATPAGLPDFDDVLRRSPNLFSSSAAFRGINPTLTGVGLPRRVDGEASTVGLFATLDVRPELGRFPKEPDVRVGTAPPVVLSDAFWRSAFGAAPNVVSSVIRLDGKAYTVIGIAPAALQQPRTSYFGSGFPKIDLWTFAPADGRGTTYVRGHHQFDTIARLAPGVAPAAVDAALAADATYLHDRYPTDDATLGLGEIPLADAILGSSRQTFVAIFAAVIVVLLVACANVANLLLSRAATREREFSVRSAIGASAGQIVAQLLVEAFVLASFGGLCGIAGAWGLVTAFVGLHPANIPRADLVTIDGASLAYTVGIVVFCTIAAGLAPALATSRDDIASALKSAGRGGDAHRGTRARSAFVASEIAMTLALVVVSGLVMRSYVSAVSQPLGFDPAGVAIVRDVSLPESSYPSDSTRDAFEQRVAVALRADPSVLGAAWANDVPFLGRMAVSTAVAGRAYAPGTIPEIGFREIGSEYFHVVRATLLAGRTFTPDDRSTTQPVAVVNESFVRAFLPGRSPLGARILPDYNPSAEPRPPIARVIVGVVADQRTSLLLPPAPEVYVPIRQFQAARVSLLVRSRPGIDVAPDVVSAFAKADPLLPKATPVSMATVVGNSVASQRLSFIALSALAAIALVLAAAGIFAVVSFGVMQRTHEYGIRIALGAASWRILVSVLVGTMRLAAAGIVLGLVVAAACAKIIGRQLYETSPLDLTTFGLACALIVVVAVFAALVPSVRATRIDPIIALRQE